MKKQIIFNPDNSGRDICRTIKTSYHKISTANLIRGGCYGASGVLEIEDVESLDRIINVGQYNSSQNSRVVSPKGISYAVTNGHKDGMPKIIQEAINTDANGNAKAIRACYGRCGYNSVFRGTGRGIAGVIEKMETKILQPSQELTVADGCLVDADGNRFRIRKLTPRECFRLMDVDDADIDRIQAAGISKTNQYKLAGNSIVVSCLYHIFRKMFVEKGNEAQQLSLF